MSQKPRVRRVLDDRLWDSEGLEWTSVLGRWADPVQVRSTLRESHSAVVLGEGQRTEWLSPLEASRLWLEIQPYFEVPGVSAAEPDADGATWAARVWTRGTTHMIGFVRHC